VSNIKTLREICTELRFELGRGTDKDFGLRNHLSLYESLFAPYRESAQRVLELGIHNGVSIRMWHEYFTQATIYGTDINGKSLARIRGIDRVVPFELDQGDKERLRLLAESGPFDICIDDCSHNWAHQIGSFEILWPVISPGGLYVIEDVVTSYRRYIDRVQIPGTKNYACYLPFDLNSPISCVEYFKRMIDHVNFDGDNWDRVEFSEYQRTIDTITFRTNAIVVKKRMTDTD